MTCCLPLFLALVLVAAAPMPAWAVNEQSVRLSADLGPQRAAERTLKRLIDEWSEKVVNVSFTPRVVARTATPGKATIHFEQVKVSVDDGWYQRYRTFHNELLKQPYAAEVMHHGVQYCQDGTFYMQAELLDARGAVLYAAPIQGLYAVSRSHQGPYWFFAPTEPRPLGPIPPVAQSLVHDSPGQPLRIEAPARLIPRIARIRVRESPNRKWPVDLGR